MEVINRQATALMLVPRAERRARKHHAWTGGGTAPIGQRHLGTGGGGGRPFFFSPRREPLSNRLQQLYGRRGSGRPVVGRGVLLPQSSRRAQTGFGPGV